MADTTAAELQEARRQAFSTLPDPSLRSPVSGSAPTLILSGSRTDQRAEARIGFFVSSLKLDVKASAPLKESADTKLADLDGLANQGSVDIGATWLRGRPTIRRERMYFYCDHYWSSVAFQDRRRMAARDYALADISILGWTEFLTLLYSAKPGTPAQTLAKSLEKDALEVARRAAEGHPPLPQDRKLVLKDLNKALGSASLYEPGVFPKLPDDVRCILDKSSPCSPPPWRALPEEITIANRLLLETTFPKYISRGPEDFVCSLEALPPKSVDRLGWQSERSALWIFTARVKAGYKKFRFADANTYAEEKASHGSSSESLTAGVLTPTGYYLGITGRYEHSFSDQDALQICRPGGVTGITTCKSTPIGAPEETKTGIAQIEMRRFLNAKFAINPRITYQFADSVKGLELPIYFLADPKKGLVGGISAGWRSDERNLRVEAFIGATFALFPGQ